MLMVFTVKIIGMKYAKEIWLPILFFVGFFVIQVYLRPPETYLFVLLLVFCGITFAVKTHPREGLVFLTGLALGLIIEVGLGLVARQQYWLEASLLGVPLWLPIAWAFGFVVITRVGIRIRRKE